MSTFDYVDQSMDGKSSGPVSASQTITGIYQPTQQYPAMASALHPPGRAPTGGQSHAHRPVSAMPTPATRTYQSSSRGEHDYYPDRRASAHPTLPTSSTQPHHFVPPSLPDAVTSNAISQGIPITSPAALQYFAAHPRRQQVHFGNYLLLQTLGEGEFGKVKLGVHKEWGEEVAVKLIKRDKVGTADGQLQISGPSKDPTKMSKVEKEIRVLKDVRHPNIVRLYEVIESDRYIGIVLEYASGGELFDHILAHKYLKERDACRLFAQLISGVFYLHEKKIVHRDLKLENLLLDRNRNVIITDFGFANNFENKRDDLMATSCGSPCYAAPELVVQDGLYAGSAVDVWSCGVILYAMLAGYLPFDDDPANPDGDNINLLYKYIMATPLSFPDYITAQPRDLLSRMLVPDPLKRADLRVVMAHPWLAPYRELFKFSVDELERAAVEQQNKKRQVYRQQILLQQQMQDQQRQGGRNQDSGAPMSVKQQRHQSAMAAPTHSQASSGRVKPDFNLPISATSVTLASPSGTATQAAIPRDVTMRDVTTENGSSRRPAGSKTQRHTVQLEYNSPANATARQAQPVQDVVMAEVPPLPTEPASVSTGQQQANGGSSQADVAKSAAVLPSAMESLDIKAAAQADKTSEAPSSAKSDSRPSEKSSHTRTTSSSQRRQSAASRNLSNPLPQAPAQPVDGTTSNGQTIIAVSPPSDQGKRAVSASQAISSEQAAEIAKAEKSQARHRKGMSTDKFLLGKLLGTQPPPTPSNDILQQINDNSVNKKGKISTGSANAVNADTSIATGRGRRTSTARRKAMSLVVGRAPESTDAEKSTKSERRLTARLRKETLTGDVKRPETPKRTTSGAQDKLIAKPSPSAASVITTRSTSTAASSNAARKVMDWFRKKSIVDEKSVTETASTQTTPRAKNASANAAVLASSIDAPSVIVTGSGQEGQVVNEMDSVPSSRSTSGTHSQTSQATDATGTTTITDVSAALPASGHKSSSASTSTVQPAQQATPRASAAPVRSVDSALRVHQGAVDQSALTSRDPAEVFRQVQRALWEMGIESKRESDTTYKLECVRRKRAKTLIDIGQSIKTSVFPPSQADYDRSASSARLPSSPSSMLSPSQSSVRNFLRRNSSQHSTDIHMPAPTYGEPSVDNGGEVRFSVELTKLRLLPGLFIVDLKRMRGNIWAYKHLNRTLLGRLDLSGTAVQTAAVPAATTATATAL